MKFIDYIDFYNNRYRIKVRYDCLKKENKIIYKYYVYSRRHLSEHTCNIIWLFLNDSGFDEANIITDNTLREEYNKYKS